MAEKYRAIEGSLLPNETNTEGLYVIGYKDRTANQTDSVRFELEVLQQQIEDKILDENGLILPSILDGALIEYVKITSLADLKTKLDTPATWLLQKDERKRMIYFDGGTIFSGYLIVTRGSRYTQWLIGPAVISNGALQTTGTSDSGNIIKRYSAQGSTTSWGIWEYVVDGSMNVYDELEDIRATYVINGQNPAEIDIRAAKGHSLSLTGTDSSLVMDKTGNTTLKATGELALEAKGDLSLTATEDMKVKADNITHITDENLAVISTTAQLVTSGDMDIEAGKEMNLNGSRSLNLSSPDGPVVVEAAGKVRLDAKDAIELTTTNQLTTSSNGISMSSRANTTIVTTGKGEINTTGTMSISTQDKTTLSGNKGVNMLSANGDISLEAKENIALDTNASVNVNADKDIDLTADNIHLSSANNIESDSNGATHINARKDISFSSEQAINLTAKEDVEINSKELAHLVGGEIALTADTTLALFAGDKIYMESSTDKNIYLQVSGTGKSYYKKDLTDFTDRDELAVIGDLRDHISDAIVQETGDRTDKVMSQKAVTGELDKKQETLISGVNIKTIEGESILGRGDIQFSVSRSNYIFGHADLVANENRQLILPEDLDSLISVFCLGIALENSFYKWDEENNIVTITCEDIEIDPGEDVFKIFYIKKNTSLPILRQVDLVANEAGQVIMPDITVDNVIMVYWQGLALDVGSYVYNNQSNIITITDANIPFNPNVDIFKVMFTK